MTGTNDGDPATDLGPVSIPDRDLPADHAFVCTECGRRWYYDRRNCPECGQSAASADSVRLETGAVVSTTTVETTPPDVRAPNHLALARFGEVRLIAQAADGNLSIGDRVRFEGSVRLRDGRERRDPRLVPVEDERVR